MSSGSRDSEPTAALRVDVGSSCLCLLALLLALPVSASAQGEDPSGLTATDLRGALIELARRADPMVESGPIRAQLDVYEIELRERLAGKEGAEARIQALRKYFFEEALLTSDDDIASPDNFYVDKVLRTKQGYCLSLSAVILCVGRGLGLPLHGVAAPRHFFVRWDDGRHRENVETTEGGRGREDRFYRDLGITPKAEADGVFLANLDDRQVIAYLLNNEGFILWSQGRSAEAETRFKQALAVHPRLAEALINLGVIAGERGDDAAAAARFTEALRWIPEDVPTWFNRSLTALKARRYREALDDLRRAEGLNRKSHHLLHYRSVVLATVLRPENWQHYQLQVFDAGEKLRREGRLRPGFLGTYFARPDLTEEVGRRVDRDIQFEWRWGQAHPRGPSDHFSIRWDGYVDVPDDGIYHFMTVSNDGIRVWVDGIPIIEDWKRNEGALHAESLDLKRGLHPVRIEYYEHTRFAGVSFRVKRADQDRPLSSRHYLHVAP